MARAGHPPPALVHPDGSVTFPELPAGPPLGLGGLPFETAEVLLPEGSTLVLYTNGLVEDRNRDVDVALDQLSRALARSDRTPEDTCQAVIEAVAPEHPGDDIALLVARTRTVPADRIATWDVPADPSQVAGVRAAATRQLSDWGLDELAFAAELMLSELVTNAVRYGTEPIQVRLVHDRTLICEVSDGSSTAPICGGRPPRRRAAAACSSSRSSPTPGAPGTPPTARSSGPNALWTPPDRSTPSAPLDAVRPARLDHRGHRRRHIAHMHKTTQ